jgi:hypothetical protein
MDILQTILGAQNGGAVSQLGSQFGLGEEQTTSALSALVPVLAAGFQRNLSNEGGIGNLISALASGNHQQYIDDPSRLAHPSTIDDGNAILGHVLGSKDASREVAARAAAQTGISPDVLKQMLPIAASLMMGAFAQRTAGAGASSQLATVGTSGSGGITDMLTPLLDGNRDGSMMDDVAGMIGRFFNRT